MLMGAQTHRIFSSGFCLPCLYFAVLVQIWSCFVRPCRSLRNIHHLSLSSYMKTRCTAHVNALRHFTKRIIDLRTTFQQYWILQSTSSSASTEFPRHCNPVCRSVYVIKGCPKYFHLDVAVLSIALRLPQWNVDWPTDPFHIMGLIISVESSRNRSSL